MRNCLRSLESYVVVVLSAVLTAAAAADVPRLIHYQGKLRTSSGAVETNPVSLRMRLYDANTGGNVLFDETHSGIIPQQGLFSLLIGSEIGGGIPNSALDSSSVFLGVSINGGTELSPRPRVASSPYSVKSRLAEQLVRPDTFQTAVAVDANGNVGVGTMTPQGKLDVDGALALAGNTGASGQLLASQGSGVAPIWTDPPSGNTARRVIDITVSTSTAPFKLTNQFGSATPVTGAIEIEAGDAGSTNPFAQFRLGGGESSLSQAFFSVLDFTKNSEFSTEATCFSNAQPGGQTHYVGVGAIVVTDSTGPDFFVHQYGFKMPVTTGSFSLIASSGNGTSEQTTTIATGITENNVQRLRAVFTAGSKVEFYRDDVLVATHTTSIPSAGRTLNQVVMNCLVDNPVLAASRTYLRVGAIWHFAQDY